MRTCGEHFRKEAEDGHLQNADLLFENLGRVESKHAVFFSRRKQNKDTRLRVRDLDVIVQQSFTPLARLVSEPSESGGNPRGTFAASQRRGRPCCCQNDRKPACEPLKTLRSVGRSRLPK